MCKCAAKLIFLGFLSNIFLVYSIVIMCVVYFSVGLVQNFDISIGNALDKVVHMKDKDIQTILWVNVYTFQLNH